MDTAAVTAEKPSRSSPFADLGDGTAQSRLTSLQQRVRRAYRLLRSVRIRQTARKAFDLTHLGTGPAERLCSALILGAAFFFVVLVLAHLAKLQADRVVGLSILAFTSVMAASGVLVLWKTDEQLEELGGRLKTELPEMRLAVLEAMVERRAEEALRAAEEEQLAAEEAARPRPTTKRCPYCREVIRIHAVKCKHCGEYLDEGLREERRPRPQQRWSPGVAAVLSFLWPGLGQIYKGEVLAGFAWMFLVALGYLFCLVPGFFLHVICIFAAASGSQE